MQSFDWCPGTPEIGGTRIPLYFVPYTDIVSWPTYDKNSNRVSSSTTFIVLREGKKWYKIDTFADKNQYTSEPQGEFPSVTQLNKLSAVIASVGLEASETLASIQNVPCAFIFVDAQGYGRLLGNPNYYPKATYQQDGGQGPTGAVASTLSIEATDLTAAPFLRGAIDTYEGEVSLGYDNN